MARRYGARGSAQALWICPAVFGSTPTLLTPGLRAGLADLPGNGASYACLLSRPDRSSGAILGAGGLGRIRLVGGVWQQMDHDIA